MSSEVNMGTLANYEKLFHMAKGELIVGADGDDISLPNRVSRIVEEWVRNGGKPLLIFHDGWKIDPKDRAIGTVGRRTAFAPLGACMAYSPRLVSDFPLGTIKGCFQDHVFAHRALLLGGEDIFINDKLVLYRVGSGVSSILYHRRGAELRMARARLSAYRQALIDIEYLWQRGAIAKERREEFSIEYNNAINTHVLLIKLMSGKILERYRAYKALWRVCKYGRKALLLKLPYLMPHVCGDGIYTIHQAIKLLIMRKRYNGLKASEG